MSTSNTLPPLSDEFQQIELGDKRRVARTQRVADNAARLPSAGLPQQSATSADLEGMYRWANNPDIAPEAVLAGHQARTAERARAAQSVLVVHDTTSFRFGGEVERDGMGLICNKDVLMGFFAHYSLCFSRRGEPLGTIGLHAWARGRERKRVRMRQQARSDPERESLRWHDAVDATGELLAEVPDVVHVMDREGDGFELLADMCEHDHRFVVRIAHDRRLQSKRLDRNVPKLYESLSVLPMMLEREVPLSRRGGPRKPAEPRRFGRLETRAAHLTIRAKAFTISPGNGAVYHLPDHLRLNFVEVVELQPPPDTEPVQWRLVTTEAIETAEQVAAVVDAYRARWQIEEFFKALKTGCNFEKLQLESARALTLTLTIYTAVAWRLLLLRWMDRNEPEAPAPRVLTATQLAALTAVCARKGKPLPKKPTAHHVLTAIAELGGHIKNNGPPGWQVLGRGFDQLLAIELGFIAAKGLV